MLSRETSSDGLTELSDLMGGDAALLGSADRNAPDPAARRRRRRLALVITAIVVLVPTAAVTGYTAWALNAPLPSPTVTSQTPGVPTAPAVTVIPQSDGASAISISGAEQYLGPDASGIWAATGTDEPRPIASLTKLVTALVVLDERPLAGPDDRGPTIVFDETDNDLYDEYYVLGATIAAMPTGSSMSQRDKLATMLVPSASNYAEAVSTWAFGSQGAFLSATRRWLAANGLNSTTIVEPTGISSRNTSTPGDLIALGKIAAANPVVAELVAMRSFSTPTIGVVSNTNDLLGSGGITGLKTGNLGENSFNLLYTASLDVGTGEPLSVTGVVLGGFSRQSVNSGVLTLLESIRDDFHDVPVISAGREVGAISTPWGSSASIIASNDTTIFTWADTPITVTMDATEPVSYEDGEIVGAITWTAGPHTATSTIEIDGTIEPPSAWWRLTHPGALGTPGAG